MSRKSRRGRANKRGDDKSKSRTRALILCATRRIGPSRTTRASTAASTTASTATPTPRGRVLLQQEVQGLPPSLCLPWGTSSTPAVTTSRAGRTRATRIDGVGRRLLLVNLDFAADPPEIEASPQAENPGNQTKPSNFGSYSIKSKPSKFKLQAIARFLKRQLKRDMYANEAKLLDCYIKEAEDDRTALAKNDKNNPKFVAVEKAHNGTHIKAPSALQYIINSGYTLRTQAKRAMHNIFQMHGRVTFADKAQLRTFCKAQEPILVTYVSGADGHYISERDRSRANLAQLYKMGRGSKRYSMP
ncbi:hypothetical protein ACHAWF_011260 [Thalassiosira exigua]